MARQTNIHLNNVKEWIKQIETYSEREQVDSNKVYITMEDKYPGVNISVCDTDWDYREMTGTHPEPRK